MVVVADGASGMTSVALPPLEGRLEPVDVRPLSTQPVNVIFATRRSQGVPAPLCASPLNTPRIAIGGWLEPAHRTTRQAIDGNQCYIGAERRAVLVTGPGVAPARTVGSAHAGLPNR